jgi:Rrf2 family protein
MLTGTTLAAIRMLVFLSQNDPKTPISPRRVAEAIGESPTYLAKVANTLTKAGLLRSHRGVTGGMTLALHPADINLLEVYEACQGKFLGDFCQDVPHDFPTCAFHQAMKELHGSVSKVLARWTLDALKGNPFSAETLGSAVPCRLAVISQVQTLESANI